MSCYVRRSNMKLFFSDYCFTSILLSQCSLLSSFHLCKPPVLNLFRFTDHLVNFVLVHGPTRKNFNLPRKISRLFFFFSQLHKSFCFLVTKMKKNSIHFSISLFFP